MKELKKMLGNDICLVIVGNKTDLEKDRHVSADEAERFVFVVEIPSAMCGKIYLRFLFQLRDVSRCKTFSLLCKNEQRH